MHMPANQRNTAPDVMAVLEEFYTHHRQELFYFCYRRLGDADLANDAVGRIFLKAINALPNFQQDDTAPGATFRAWLYRIARNDLSDLYRTHKPTQSLEQLTTDGHLPRDPHEPSPGPESTAMQRDAAHRLRAMLQTLPDNQRAIVELRLAGLSGAEIASALDLTMAAVKSAQYRAYAKLRDLLADTDLDPRMPS